MGMGDEVMVIGHNDDADADADADSADANSTDTYAAADAGVRAMAMVSGGDADAYGAAGDTDGDGLYFVLCIVCYDDITIPGHDLVGQAALVHCAIGKRAAF